MLYLDFVQISSQIPMLIIFCTILILIFLNISFKNKEISIFPNLSIVTKLWILYVNK